MSNENKKINQEIDPLLNDTEIIAPYKGNLHGQTQTTSQWSKEPDKITTTAGRQDSTTTYEQLSDDDKLAIKQAGEEAVRASGFGINPDGTWKDESKTIGSVLRLKDETEEIEKANRLKATNAGVYNVLSLLGDMITAGVGGDVAKREKMDVAEKAAADTMARRDALLKAEQAAEQLVSARRLEAWKNKMAAENQKRAELAKKVTEANVGETTSTVTGGKTTGGQTTWKSPEEVKTRSVYVADAKGRVKAHNIDETRAKEYELAVENWIDTAELSPAAKAYMRKKGWISQTTNTIKPSAAKYIMDDPNMIQFFSDDLKRLNRKLYRQSIEFARYIDSKEYKKLSAEQKAIEKARRIAEYEGEIQYDDED